MWKGPGEDPGGPEGGGSKGGASQRELQDLKDQYEQQQTLIAQLKEMLRKTDQPAINQEKVAEYANTLTKMNARAKRGHREGQPSTRSDDKPKNEKVALLQQQLEQNRAKLAERGKNQKGMEQMVTQIRAQLDDSQHNLSLTQTPLNISLIDDRVDYTPSTNPQELYNILLNKDKRLNELTCKITRLEANVIDLQENIKEKDSVIDARTKAITLMTENLTKKGKNTLDTLDDTKEQMRKMQENFVAMEEAMKAENEKLLSELKEIENVDKDLRLELEEKENVNRVLRLELEEKENVIKYLKLETDETDGSVLNQLKQRVCELEELNSTNKNYNLEELLSKNGELEELKKKNEELSEKIFDLEETIKKNEECINELSKKNSDLEESNQRIIDELKKTNEENKKQSSESPDGDLISQLRKRIADLESLSREPSPQTGKRGKKGKQQKQSDNVTTKIVELENLVKERESKIKELETEIEERNKDITDHKQTIEDLRKDLSEKEVVLQKAQDDSKKLLEELAEKQKSIELRVLNEAELQAIINEQLERLKGYESADIGGESPLVVKLRQQLDESNKNMIKAKAQHKSKVKELNKKIDQFKKIGDLNAAVVRLEAENSKHAQRIAELEEEKGQLQLNMVESKESINLDEVKDLEDRLREYLEEIAEKNARIATLEQTNEENETKINELTCKLDDLTSTQNARIKSDLTSVQYEEHLEKLESEKREMLAEKEDLERDNKALAEKLENARKEKQEISNKLDHYMQENIDLMDRLEKLSAEKVSSAESIEIVENLTQQEKLELEAYQNAKSSESVELNESVTQLNEETAELLQKIELFTVERREVMEKMEALTAENNQLGLKLKEVENNRDVLVETYEQLQTEKEELDLKLEKLERAEGGIEEEQLRKEIKELKINTEEYKNLIEIQKQEIQELRLKIISGNNSGDIIEELQLKNAEFELKNLELEKRMGDFEDKLRESVEEIEAYKSAIEGGKGELIASTNLVEDLREKLREKSLEVEHYETEVLKLSEMVTELNALNETKADANIEELEILKKSLNDNLKLIEDYEVELNQNSSTITGMNAEMKKLNDRIVQTENLLQEKEEEISKIKQEKELLRENNNTLENAMRDKENAFKTSCEELKERYLRLQKQVENNSDSFAPLDVKVQELEKKNREQLEKMKKIAANLKKKTTEYKELEIKYQQLESSSLVLKQRCEDLEVNNQDLLTKNRESEINSQNLNSETAKQDLHDLNAENRDLRLACEELGLRVRDLESEKGRLDEELGSVLSGKREIEEKLAGEVKELEKTRNDLQLKSKMVRKLQAKLKEEKARGSRGQTDEEKLKTREESEEKTTLEEYEKRTTIEESENEKFLEESVKKTLEESEKEILEESEKKTLEESKGKKIEITPSNADWFGETSESQQIIKKQVLGEQQSNLKLENFAELQEKLQENLRIIKELKSELGVKDELINQLKRDAETAEGADKQRSPSEDAPKRTGSLKKQKKRGKTPDKRASSKIRSTEETPKVINHEEKSKALDEKQQVLQESERKLEEKRNDLEEVERKLRIKESDLEEKSRRLEEEFRNLEEKTTHLQEQLKNLECASQSNSEQIQKEIQDKNTLIKKLKIKLQEKIKVSGQEIQELRARIEESERKNAELTQKNSNDTAQFEDLQNIIREYENQTARLTEQLESLRSDANNASNIELSRKDEIISELNSRLEAKEINSEALQMKINELEMYIETQELELVRVKGKNEQLEEGLRSVEKRRKSLEDKALLLGKELEEKKENARDEDLLEERLKLLAERDQAVENSLKETLAENQNLLQENQKISGELVALKTQLETSEKKLLHIQEEIARLEELENENSELRRNVNNLEGDLRRVNQELNYLKEQREKAEAELQEQLEQYNSERRDLMGRLELALEEVKELERAKEDLKSDNGDLIGKLDQQQLEFEENLRRYQSLEVEYRGKMEILDGVSRKCGELEEKLAQLENNDVPQQQIQQKTITTEHSASADSSHPNSMEELSEKLKTMQFMLFNSEKERDSALQQCNQLSAQLAQLVYEKLESQITVDSEETSVQRKSVEELGSERPTVKVKRSDLSALSSTEVEVEEPMVMAKKTFVCYKEEDDNKSDDIFGEGDGWGGETTEVIDEANAALQQKIRVLELERDNHAEELKQAQIKSAKLIKKLKEFKLKNEQLLKSKNDGFSDLNDAIVDELKAQVSTLEKRSKEINAELEKEKNEKGNLLKRIDVLTSANERMIEMKEKQDIELLSWQQRNRDLNLKLEQLEWGDEKIITQVAQKPPSGDNQELLDTIKELTLDNEELQAMLEEQRKLRLEAEKSKQILPENVKSVVEYNQVVLEKSGLEEELKEKQKLLEENKRVIEETQKLVEELMNEKAGLIEERGGFLKEKEELIEKLKNEKDGLIESVEKNKSIEGREELLEEKEKLIEEKQKLIEALKDERDRLIEERGELLIEKEKLIEELKIGQSIQERGKLVEKPEEKEGLIEGFANEKQKLLEELSENKILIEELTKEKQILFEEFSTEKQNKTNNSEMEALLKSTQEKLKETTQQLQANYSEKTQLEAAILESNITIDTLNQQLAEFQQYQTAENQADLLQEASVLKINFLEDELRKVRAEKEKVEVTLTQYRLERDIVEESLKAERDKLEFERQIMDKEELVGLVEKYKIENQQLVESLERMRCEISDLKMKVGGEQMIFQKSQVEESQSGLSKFFGSDGGSQFVIEPANNAADELRQQNEHLVRSLEGLQRELEEVRREKVRLEGLKKEPEEKKSSAGIFSQFFQDDGNAQIFDLPLAAGQSGLEELKREEVNVNSSLERLKREESGLASSLERLKQEESAISSLLERLKQEENMISSSVEQLRQEESLIASSLERLKQEASSLERLKQEVSSLEQLKQEASSLEKLRQEESVISSSVEQLKQEESLIASSLARLKQEASSLEQLQQEAALFERFKQEESGTHSSLEQLKQEESVISSSLKQLKLQHDDLQVILENLRREKDEAALTLEQLNHEKNEVASSLEQLKPQHEVIQNSLEQLKREHDDILASLKQLNLEKNELELRSGKNVKLEKNTTNQKTKTEDVSRFFTDDSPQQSFFVGQFESTSEGEDLSRLKLQNEELLVKIRELQDENAYLEQLNPGRVAVQHLQIKSDELPDSRKEIEPMVDKSSTADLYNQEVCTNLQESSSCMTEFFDKQKDVEQSGFLKQSPVDFFNQPQAEKTAADFFNQQEISSTNQQFSGFENQQAQMISGFDKQQTEVFSGFEGIQAKAMAVFGEKQGKPEKEGIGLEAENLDLQQRLQLLENSLAAKESEMGAAIQELNQKWAELVDQRGYDVAESWKLHLETRESEFAQLEQQLRNQILELEQKCNCLLQENSDLRRNVDEEVKQELDKINVLRKLVEEKEAEIVELKSKYEEFEQMQVDLSNYTRIISELNMKIQELEGREIKLLEATENEKHSEQLELQNKELVEQLRKENELKLILEQQKEELSVKIEELQNEKLILKQQKEELSVKIDELQNALEGLKQQNAELANQLQKSGPDLETLKLKIDSLENEKGFLEQLNPERVAVAELKQQNEELAASLIELRNSTSEEKDRLISKLQIDCKEKENDLKEARLYLEDLKNQNAHEKDALQSSVRNLEQQLGEYAQQVNHYSVQLQESYLHSENLRRELEALNGVTDKDAEIVGMKNFLEEKQREFSYELERKTQELQSVITDQQQELEVARRKLQDLEVNHVELFNANKNIEEFYKKQIHDLQQDMQKQDQAGRIAELEEVIRDDEKQLLELKNIIEEQVLKIEELKQELYAKSNNYDALVAQLDLKNLPKPTSSLVSTSEIQDEDLVEPVSRAKLDFALYMLHQRDVRCEELTMELMQLLEERDTLQLRLSNALREKEQLRASAEKGEAEGGKGDAGRKNVPGVSAGAVPKSKAIILGATGTELAAEATESLTSLPSSEGSLATKLSELKSVGYKKDKTIVDEQALRRIQQLSILQEHQDEVAKLPPEAAARLVDASYTLSRDVQSPSKVLLNWLWGTSTPKVNNV